jgi:hypothetical protein
MTSERAAALAAARRRGLSLEQTGFRFAEVPLESPESRNRPETVSAEDGAREDLLVARFLAQHAPSP